MTANELRNKWVDAFGPLMPKESRFQFWERFYPTEEESNVLLWNFIRATTDPDCLPLVDANKVAEWIHRKTLVECHEQGFIVDYNEVERILAKYR